MDSDLDSGTFEVVRLQPASASPFPSLDDRLGRCEDRLGYRFNDRRLLEMCLTHASVARTRLESNERMEFLGDSILGHLVCEALYHRFPEEAEGELTRIKSAIVSRTTCAKMSYGLHLDDFLLLGKGLSAHNQIPLSIMAAVFESLVAGLYLDGGMEAVRLVVEPVVEPEIEHAAAAGNLRNFKSLLQQIAQKTFNETPSYRLLDEKGPDHSKCFKVAAVIGPNYYPAAWGASKKEAEQRAAQNALCDIEGLELPHAAD